MLDGYGEIEFAIVIQVSRNQPATIVSKTVEDRSGEAPIAMTEQDDSLSLGVVGRTKDRDRQIKHTVGIKVGYRYSPGIIMQRDAARNAKSAIAISEHDVSRPDTIS